MFALSGVRCLIELDAAITHGIPIVALNCVGKEYNFVDALDFLLHLETSLHSINPDAIGVLKKHDIDPIRLAHKLWSVIPNIISVSLDTSASDNAINATMHDLVKAMNKASKPLPTSSESFAVWLKNRATRETDALERALASNTIRGTQRGRMLQKIERAEELAEELRVAQDGLRKERGERSDERQWHEAAMAKKDAMIERLMEKL